MLPLPLLSEVESVLDPDGKSAWERLLGAEKTALALSAAAPATNKRDDLVIAARVVGFLVLDFRTQGRAGFFAERAHCTLVEAVHSCWREPGPEEDCHKKVIDLGFYYKNRLIQFCMSR
jgi:hypothetical protein